MTAIATAPATARSGLASGRVAPRPTPRSGPTASRSGRAVRPLRAVEAPKRRYPARAVAVVAVVLVFGSMLASAIFHSVLVTGQARLDELGREISVAEKGLAHDRLELARLVSPQRIATEAERLGLVVADQQTWIRPGSDRAPIVTGRVDGGAADDTGGASDGRADERALTAGDGAVPR